MATRIVSLQAKLGLDGTGFQQGLRRAGAFAGSWAGSMKGQIAGAFGATSVALTARHIANTVSRFKDLSEQYRVSTDEVQRFDAAAKMSNQTFEDVGGYMERFNKAQKEAAEGNEELQALFERFGSTFEEFAQNADSNALIEIFGRRGTRLKAIFEDLKNVKFKLISQEDIEAIDQAGKKLELLKSKMLALGARTMRQGMDLSFWDFIPGLMGMPEDQKSQKGMSKDEVAAANARKHFQDQQAFESDAMAKEKAGAKEIAKLRKEAAEEERKIREKMFDIQRDIAFEKAGAQKDDFLKGMNVGDLGRKGGFGGMSIERGLGLRGQKDKSAEIERNTKRAVEVLKMIHGKIGSATGLDLDFH